MASSDPFAAPAEDRPYRRGPSLWNLVRFAVRRILLVGAIPFAVAVVGGSLGGVTAFFVAWAVPLLLWLPSTLVLLKVMLSSMHPPADPRAVELADGRVLSRADCRLYIGARAWEGGTTALLLPVLALGFWRYSPAAAAGLTALLAIVPVVLLRYQWLGLQAGRAVLFLASEQAAPAEQLLTRIVDARLLAPAFRRNLRLLLARAVARQGRIDEALALLRGQTDAHARLTVAQIQIGRGELDLARELLDGGLPEGFSGDLGRAFLTGLVHLHADEPEVVVDAARGWGPLQDRIALHTARFLDLLHACALWQLGRRDEAQRVVERRDAHTDDWPWLDALYPKIGALRDELVQARR